MTATHSPLHHSAARISATAFVDWTAQMHGAGVRRGTDVRTQAQRAFEQTTRLVQRALTDEPARFRVALRLYHGWHKGWQATEHLKATIHAVANDNVVALSSPRVSFSPTVQYGHTLLSALPERQHRNPPVHLPNTLRQHVRGGGPTEKMVDTALAADLLAWARYQPIEWALVLAEDDDLIPPLYTAEAWVRSAGGRTLLVRRRAAGQYLKLDGILRQVR